MKKRIGLCIAVVIIALMTIAVLEIRIMEDNFLKWQSLKKLPAGYVNETVEQGRLKVIKYKTEESESINILTNRTITKKAVVYIPYGYDSREKYDIMYIMHGRGGSYKTWLGIPGQPRAFKNVLDNMIQNKDIKPLIVVAPNLAYEYGDDDSIMEGTCREIAMKLMPAVESKFSTYAEAGTDDGLCKSRNHRCFAGFSMGGSLTWHMLKNHIEYFRYYIPMSMATYYDKNGYSKQKSINSAKEIRESLNNSEYSYSDFEIFAATGDADFKAEATAMQVYDLLDDKKFVYTDKRFDKGNITFKMWPGKWHRYINSYPYLYNAMTQFFGVGK